MTYFYRILFFLLIIIIIMDYYKKYIKYKEKYLNLKNKNGGYINEYSYNNNLWIYPNFFSHNEFNKIMSLCKNLKFKNDQRVNSRKTLCLKYSEHEKIYNLIYKNKKFINAIKKISKKKYKIKPSFPIEYRIYPTGSSGMRWHEDTSMFTPDCLEVVLTLINTSDSQFVWKEYNNKNIIPKENTLVIVKPSSVLHKVTPVNHGIRTILKFIVEFEGSEPKSNYYKEIGNCPY
jgi:hypothetical protein